MQVNLSFSEGIEVDRNTSRRLLQRLRLALRWEEAPVITGFDPRFNQSQPLWCAAAPACSLYARLLMPASCRQLVCDFGSMHSTCNRQTCSILLSQGLLVEDMQSHELMCILLLLLANWLQLALFYFQLIASAVPF